VIAVAKGGSHNLALSRDGRLWAWGRNDRGQLGSAAGDASTPVAVDGLGPAVAIAAGANHSLAVLTDGSLWAWGANDSGQVGIAANSDVATPVQVRGLRDIVDVAAGSSHSVAIDAQGRVFAWGAKALAADLGKHVGMSFGKLCRIFRTSFAKETVADVVRLLIESLRALAHARPIEEPRRHRLDQRLNELLDRVSPASR
jgi:alpha-tubulin suppressor-like RCC1 family protein